MATNNPILSYAPRPVRRFWPGPWTRRVVATLIACMLIFVGLSQLVERKPTFPDTPDRISPIGRPLLKVESQPDKVEINFPATPDEKAPARPPHDYKLHLDQ